MGRSLAVLLLFLCSGSASAQGVEPLRMLPRYLDETTRAVEPVHHYSDAVLKKLEVFIGDGRLLNPEGQAISSYLTGPSLYIIDTKGRLLVSPYSKHGLIHHSSLSGGADVLFAGQIVVQDGVLLAIDRESGHYRAPASYMEPLKTYFQNYGIDLQTHQLGQAAVVREVRRINPGCDRLVAW
jgi:hypothetical protein